MTRLLVALALMLVASACDGRGTGDLIVEVRSDFLPGVEFDSVRTRVFIDDSETPEREMTLGLSPDLDVEAFASGVRVAESAGIPFGDVVVVVALLDESSVAAEAHVRTDFSMSTALTIPITRSCEDVSCPDGEQSLCLAGRCVTPGCAAGTEPCDFETLTFADFPRAFTEAACDRLRRCGGARFDANFEGHDCVEALTPSYEDTAAVLLAAALERGTLTYDASLARACAEAAGSIGCASDAASFDLVECYEAFFRPGMLDGCHVDIECATDSYCDTSAACPGQCAPRRPAGEPCHDDAMCLVGSTCAGSTASGDAGTCTPISGTGDPCGPGAAVCRADHFCVGARRAPTPRFGTCQPVEALFVGRLGEDCDVGSGPFCTVGLSCVSHGSGSSGVCSIHPREPGADCAFSFPDVCPAGEFRSLGPDSFLGTCEPLPRGGEPCVAEPAKVRCAPSHRCASDVCIPLGRIGDECRASAGCANANCVEGFCAAPICSRLL